ncbi:MAG: single-stranded DNA-binding protein [Planctomycetes bacterium]|nr:single-stranded DNA-binding protein [Planctomycetota bacterium]
MHMNHVFLIGNVCKDPEPRFVGPSQTPVTDLRLACNRTWKSAKGEKREESLFIDVVAWARSAELAVQYLKKGRLVGIEGRLQLNEWTGQDGRKNQRIRVVAERICFLPGGAGSRDAVPAQESIEVSTEGVHEEEEARIPA